MAIRERPDYQKRVDQGRRNHEPGQYFTERERAALAFTESVTLLAEDHVPPEAYDEVAACFTPDEVAALVSLIVTINGWNRIATSTRAWIPGSYEP